MDKDRNELLTRVGPGTAMGGLFREYWLPALLEEDLPEPGGLMLRVRLLGEDLLFVRSPGGEVGLIGPRCPHRGASLYFGRNEDCGVRCAYHGWKFDLQGNCIDLPNDPRGETIKHHIKHKAYPVRIHGGIVWAYLGTAKSPPPLPDLEWLDLPADQVHLSIRVQHCNYLQALEGEIDSSHAGLLHGRIDGGGQAVWDKLSDSYDHPTFKVVPSEAGLQIGACRDVDDTTCYWRVNQFMLPFWTIVPPSGEEPDLNGHAWVPIDDTMTLCVMYSYKLDGPYSERREKLYSQGARGRESGHASVNAYEPADPTRPYGLYWPKYNAGNDYGLDIEAQRTKYFSGMHGLWVQDAGLQESMGAIADRSLETLCASDIGIAQVRQLLRKAAEDFADDGTLPASATDPSAYRIRSVGIVLPRDVPFAEGAAEHLRAEGQLAYEII